MPKSCKLVHRSSEKCLHSLSKAEAFMLPPFQIFDLHERFQQVCQMKYVFGLLKYMMGLIEIACFIAPLVVI